MNELFSINPSTFFLAKYQTQVLMISYMYFDIVKLNRSQMQIDVKHDIDGCMSGQDLWKIGLNKENVSIRNLT